MNQALVLDVRDLRVDIGSHAGVAKVLVGVNLTIHEGETVALVGESGCGKSLTVKTILRMISPPITVTGGEVFFRGTNLLALPEAELWELRGKRISYIPQDPMTSLNPVFTIEQQFSDLLAWQGQVKIGMGRVLRSGRSNSDSEVKNKILNILKAVKIPSPEVVMKRYPFQLSGGMAQRVLIAMAIASKPELLIADEPGTALDVVIQNTVLELLKQEIDAVGLSVLFITHDLGVAKRIAGKISVMYGGRIIESAPTEEIFMEPMHPYTVGLLSSVPRLAGQMAEGIPGKVPDYIDPPLGCRFNPRCPKVMDICRHAEPKFVEVRPNHNVACYLYQGA